jgi:hypothetical protein
MWNKQKIENPCVSLRQPTHLKMSTGSGTLENVFKEIEGKEDGAPGHVICIGT